MNLKGATAGGTGPEYAERWALTPHTRAKSRANRDRHAGGFFAGVARSQVSDSNLAESSFPILSDLA